VNLDAKAYLIAGTQSGCGKTTATLAVMQYLRRQGKRIAPFKAGPDFLDPMWHKAVCGRTSYTIDTRMVGVDESKRLLMAKMVDADIAIIEGVMGLFDGAKGVGGEGSSAHLAQVLDVSVLLVVSAKGMSGSLVALVEGFVARAKSMDVVIAGIIANHVGSENHAKILRELLKNNDLPPLVAWLNKNAPSLSERHLGLKMPNELDLPDFSDVLHMDDELSAQNMRLLPVHASHGVALLRGKTIAVASDAAFCFIYPANIEWFASQGAELVYFSPLAGEAVPKHADALWLPGGYPELHVDALEKYSSWASIDDFIEKDKPVLAECGGMMVLGRSITNHVGETAHMANIIACTFTMQDKLAGLGYRKDECGVCGHEFHHSKRQDLDDMTPCFTLQRGDSGIRYKGLRASYIHWYFASQPYEVATWFGGVGEGDGD